MFTTRRISGVERSDDIVFVQITLSAGRKLAQKRKPMTVEEAVMEMDKTKDYLVYWDAQTDRVSVLLRRRDGHFDLVEG